MHWRGLLVALALLLTPLTAAAGVRPWLSGSIGASMFDMTDVNADISSINAALAGSGLQMDEVGGGMVLGAAFGMDVGNGWSFGLGFDHLAANSEVGDPSGRIEYDLPANLGRILGRYSFASGGKGSGFVELAVGRVRSAGAVNLSVTGVGAVTGNMEGSGSSVEGSFGGTVWTAPQFALHGSVGYRHAVVNDLTVNGTPIFNAAGSRYALDYSGLFVRLGVMIAFAK